MRGEEGESECGGRNGEQKARRSEVSAGSHGISERPGAPLMTRPTPMAVWKL